MALILAVGFSIFISLLAILFVGNNVTWWQVRVNQQSYSIGSIQIPQMAVTLRQYFFTSILILSWTVGNDVSKTAVEIHELELNHANPGLLLKKREAALSQIQGAVGIKAYRIYRHHRYHDHLCKQSQCLRSSRLNNHHSIRTRHVCSHFLSTRFFKKSRIKKRLMCLLITLRRVQYVGLKQPLVGDFARIVEPKSSRASG